MEALLGVIVLELLVLIIAVLTFAVRMIEAVSVMQWHFNKLRETIEKKSGR